MSDSHHDEIVDQFTRQAALFAEKHRSHDEAFRLAIETSGVLPSDTVLDVACGPGLVACAFAKVARAVAGADVTPAMLARARSLQAEMGLANITWRECDVTQLPFDAASFDVVVTRYSFHHFQQPATVLAEMVRVCKPGGTLCVIDATPRADAQNRYNAFEKLRDPSHVRAMTHAELQALLEQAGLEIVRQRLYWWEVALEKQLAVSFPADRARDEPALRAMISEDVGHDRVGMNAHMRDGAVWFGYPTTIFACRCPM